MNQQYEPMTMPYVGLMPFLEWHHPYFFGRDADRNRLLANLLANRLTLVYGASGVGKSSALRAGVLPALHKQAAQNRHRFGTPRYVVAYFSTWRESPLLALRQTIQAALTRDCAPPDPVTNDHSDFLAQLRAWTTTYKVTVLLVLDQFEEYFLYHPTENGAETIAGALVGLLNDPDLSVNVLLSLRDDGLAKLDRFKGQISFLLDNRLTIEHLNRTAATDAIRKPLGRFNQDHQTNYTVEDECVSRILKDVARGKTALTIGGTGDTAIAPAKTDRIEAPYLQLVLEALWNKEVEAGSDVLRLETLSSLGGAEKIVQNYLNKTMEHLDKDNQAIAARFFDRLVTSGGTKIALSLAELSDKAKAAPSVVEQVLAQLQSARLVRSVQSPGGITQYEIFHDVMAQAVVAWQKRYEQAEEVERSHQEEREKEALAHAKAEAEQNRRSENKQRIYTTIACVAVGVSVIFALIAINRWQVANQNATKSRALLFQLQGERIFDQDPMQGLRILAEALVVSNNSDIQSDLKASLIDMLATGRILRLGKVEQSVEQIYAFNVAKDLIIVDYFAAHAELWDLKNGVKIAPLSGQLNSLYHRGIEGEFIVLINYADAPAEIWDIKEGIKVANLSGQLSSNPVYPNEIEGQAIVLINYDDVPDELWNLARGTNAQTLTGQVARFTPSGVAGQPFGLVTYEDNKFPDELWNLETGTERIRLSGKVANFYNSQMIGQPIALVDYDNLETPDEWWNLATGTRVEFPLTGQVSSLVTSGVENQPWAVVSYTNERIPPEWWNLNTGERGAEPLAGGVFALHRSRFAEQPYAMIEYRSGSAELWNLATGERATILAGDASLMLSGVAEQPFALVNYYDSSIPAEIWDLKNGTQTEPSLKGDASLIASGVADQPFALIDYSDEAKADEWWNLQTGEPGTGMLAGSVSSFYRSRTVGQPIALVDYNNEGIPDELWNLTSGIGVTQLVGQVTYLYGSEIEKQDFAVINYADSNIPDELRNLRTGQFVSTFNKPIANVFFSGADTQPIATLYFEDGTSQLWNMETGTLVTTTDQATSEPVDIREYSKYSIVTYLSGSTQVIVGKDETAPLLVDLGLGYNGSDIIVFGNNDEESDHMVATYADGRAYILDLTMLTQLSKSEIPIKNIKNPDELDKLVRWLCGYIRDNTGDVSMEALENNLRELLPLEEGESLQACQADN